MGEFVLFFLLKKFFKSADIAAIATFYLFVVYLFFGSIKDSFPNDSIFYSYQLLVPVIIIIPIINYFILKKNNSLLQKEFQFIQFLMLLLLLLQSILFYQKSPIQIKLNSTDFVKSEVQNKTNFHLILLDGYPGSQSLNDLFSFDNSDFKNYLRNQNCFVSDSIKSNYCQTYYSINSMLNMQYLRGLNNVNITDYGTIMQQLDQINRSTFFQLLQQNGYSIMNNSIFKIENQNPIHSDLKFSSTSAFLFRNTFLNRILKDNLWRFTEGKMKIESIYQNIFFKQYQQNQKQIDFVKNFKEKSPYFVYTHLLMPHEPYYTDSLGKLILGEVNSFSEKELFINYLKYTNIEVKQMFQAIRKNDSNAVIIIMSDHGHRDMDTFQNQQFKFDNFFAIYTPEKNYELFKKLRTNVNTFRLLSNEYFQQKLPLLQDTLFLIDEEQAKITSYTY